MQRLVLALLAVIAALLAACSTVRLSYEHADWLIVRMAARYIEPTDSQAREFRTRVAQFHAWHRSEELPRYAQVFDEAAERVGRGLSRPDVEWAVEMVRGRARVLGERAGEELGPVLHMLSDRQLAEMERQFEKDNDKFVKAQISGDSARHAARRATWLCDRLQDWVGPLTRAQRTRVQLFVATFPDVPQLRLEERRRRQAVFLEIVRDHRNSPQLEALLSAFLADPAAERPQANGQTRPPWQAGLVDMLVDLDRSLTPEQRRTAVARLRAYAADFRALGGQQVAVHQGPSR